MTTATRGPGLAVLAAALLALTACSPKANDAADTGGNGPGVSTESVKLGVLVDLSGAFAAGGQDTVRGLQLTWDRLNGEGKVCDRRVDLVVQDHGYNTQTAVNQYTAMKKDVLAFQMVLGSPMVSALLPSIEDDEVVTIPSSFATELLENPYIVMTGTTYEVEMRNALKWLVEKNRIKPGDTVGHIYLQGAYGENALAGTRAAANEFGLKVVTQQVRPDGQDLTGQVRALHDAGARYVMLTTTPVQTASAVAVSQASGFGVTFVGSTFTFVPSLLSGAAGQALATTFYQSAIFSPFASDLPGPTKLRQDYEKKYAGSQPSLAVVHGAAAAEVMHSALAAACDNGKLTRDGLYRALQKLTAVDTDGLLPPLTFTAAGKPATSESFLLRPDKAVPGGLKPAG